MQSGDRLDVEIIPKEKKTVKILNFVSLARTAAKWNCDMVQVVPLCGKRRRGSSLSLCDKHDMFRDLQADNAIDFADFTDLRPNPSTIQYTHGELYAIPFVHSIDNSPVRTHANAIKCSTLTLTQTNREKIPPKTFYGRRNAHCFYCRRMRFFLCHPLDPHFMRRLYRIDDILIIAHKMGVKVSSWCGGCRLLAFFISLSGLCFESANLSSLTVLDYTLYSY